MPCSPVTALRWAPCRDSRTIRRRQIAGDHTIGNLVADAICPHWSSDGAWTASQIVQPVQPCGIRGLATPYLLRSDRLSPVAEDRPHFYVATLGAAYAAVPAQLAVLTGPGQRVRLTMYHRATALHARQAGPGSRSPPKIGARRSAAIYGHSERPRERPPPAFPARSGRTRAARFASRPHAAASPGSSRPTGSCRSAGFFHWPRRSTTPDRWPATSRAASS